MLPVEFEPTIPASELPQTHDLDRAATGIGFPPIKSKYLTSAPVNTHNSCSCNEKDQFHKTVPMTQISEVEFSSSVVILSSSYK
jgi:hypothetical protein